MAWKKSRSDAPKSTLVRGYSSPASTWSAAGGEEPVPATRKTKMAKTKKKTKRNIPAAARAKATETRQMRSVFNRYLKSLSSKRAENWKAKIQEIQETLEKGTKSRVVPKFTGGKRVGTEVKDVALQPADRAKLIAKRRELEGKVANAGSEKLRAEFLEILPVYAAAQGWDRDLLLEVGVPERDLSGIE